MIINFDNNLNIYLNSLKYISNLLELILKNNLNFSLISFMIMIQRLRIHMFDKLK